MNKRIVITSIIVSAILGAGAIGFTAYNLHMRSAPPALVATQPAIEAPQPTERPLLELLNEIRAKHGLGPLIESQELNRTAGNKADDLGNLNYWSHSRPNGEDFSEAIYRVIPRGTFVGENLSKCHTSNQQAINSWVNSPTHLENILRAEFTKTGFQTFYDEDIQCNILVNHFSE